MTAATKSKNGKAATDAIVDLAAQAGKGIEVASKSLRDAVDTYADSSLLNFDAQQRLMQTNFDLYQKYLNAYSDLVSDVYQYGLDQSLALREQFAGITKAYYEKAEALGKSEQEFVFEMAESFQKQARANTERVIELFATAK